LIDSDKRNDILRVDGFNLGKTDGSALSQSIYSVESCFDQKARSSSSFLNFGIFFNFFGILSCLFSVHILAQKKRLAKPFYGKTIFQIVSKSGVLK